MERADESREHRRDVHQEKDLEYSKQIKEKSQFQGSLAHQETLKTNEDLKTITNNLPPAGKMTEKSRDFPPQIQSKMNKSVNFTSLKAQSEMYQNAGKVNNSTIHGGEKSKTFHNHSMTEKSSLHGNSAYIHNTTKQSLLARVAHMNNSMFESFNKKGGQNPNLTASRAQLPT
jgi:hypothetical protein